MYMRERFSGSGPAEWLSADIFSDVPLTSVTLPAASTTVASELNETDLRSGRDSEVAIMCVLE